MIIALAFFITVTLWLLKVLSRTSRLVQFQREYIEIIEDELQEMEQSQTFKQERLITQIEDNLKTIKAQSEIIEYIKNEYVDKERIK